MGFTFVIGLLSFSVFVNTHALFISRGKDACYSVEQISYEWEELLQIRSRAVAVQHYAVIVAMSCVWMRHTCSNGLPFPVYHTGIHSAIVFLSSS
jgi:hypothetical protein